LTLDALIDQIVPQAIRLTTIQLEAVSVRSNARVEKCLKIRCSGLLGWAITTALPTVIQRNILENPAAPPPLISQRLPRTGALLNFQTMIIDLTGLEIANASY